MRISPRCLSALRHLAFRFSVAALAAPMALIATSCGQSPTPPPPVVIERVVEVTREVPVEATREVPVEATRAMPAGAEEEVTTATLASQQPRSLILYQESPHSGFGKLQTIAARENAKLNLGLGYEVWDAGGPKIETHKGAIVIAGDGGFNHDSFGITEEIIVDLHSYVNRGGRLIFFVLPRMEAFNNLLQDTFKVQVVGEHVTPPDTGELHVDGAALSSLWTGLTIGSNNSYQGRGDPDVDYITAIALRSYLEPLDDSFPVTRVVSGETGKSRALSVLAKIGKGEALFVTAFSTGGGGNMYRGMALFFNDDSFDLWDNEEATRRMIPWLLGLTEESDFLALPTSRTFDAASILARFSTGDPRKGEERAGASGEIIAQYSSGNADTDRVLDLLHTISPELSLDELQQAADELARLSGDDEWDGAERAAVVSHLAALVTGTAVNAEMRIAAAKEMVALYRVGDLNADRTLGLMDTIAPSLSLDERKKAARMLAKLSAANDWEETDRAEAANEVFRLVTGVPLEAEKRLGAAVDLAGIGVKVFDTEGQFDDRDIDIATELIKQSLTGELTVESVESLLGLVH